MPDYVLAIYDENGARQEIPLRSDVLGYPHVVLVDENDLEVHVPNVPEAAPPVGRFPAAFLDGSELLIDFEPEGGIVDGGQVVSLVGPVATLLDFTPRRNMAQIGDTPRVRIDFRDDADEFTTAGATLLEVVLERPVGGPLVRNAIAVAGSTTAIEAQLQVGDIQSAGAWRAQGHAVLAGGAEFRSRSREFVVLHNLPTA